MVSPRIAGSPQTDPLRGRMLSFPGWVRIAAGLEQPQPCCAGLPAAGFPTGLACGRNAAGATTATSSTMWSGRAASGWGAAFTGRGSGRRLEATMPPEVETVACAPGRAATIAAGRCIGRSDRASPSACAIPAEISTTNPKRLPARILTFRLHFVLFARNPGLRYPAPPR